MRQNMTYVVTDTDSGECSAEKQSREDTVEDNVLKEAAESLSMFFAAASSGQWSL